MKKVIMKLAILGVVAVVSSVIVMMHEELELNLDGEMGTMDGI